MIEDLRCRRPDGQTPGVVVVDGRGAAGFLRGKELIPLMDDLLQE
jgi:hypothetical protein